MAHWTTLSPRTGLPGLPPLAFVLTGAGPTALDNRIRTVAQVSREHWAPQRMTTYFSYRGDPGGDFYLDFTGRIPLVMTTLDRLKQHGPMGPCWCRIDGHHRDGIGRSRGGLTTKVHLAADDRCRPLVFVLTPG